MDKECVVLFQSDAAGATVTLYKTITDFTESRPHFTFEWTFEGGWKMTRGPSGQHPLAQWVRAILDMHTTNLTMFYQLMERTEVEGGAG